MIIYNHRIRRKLKKKKKHDPKGRRQVQKKKKLAQILVETVAAHFVANFSLKPSLPTCDRFMFALTTFLALLRVYFLVRAISGFITP